MKSPASVWLVSFESTPPGIAPCQTWWSKILWKWKYQFLYQLLTEYLGKSWIHRLDRSYWEIFKIRNTNIPESLNQRIQAIAKLFFKSLCWAWFVYLFTKNNLLLQVVTSWDTVWWKITFVLDCCKDYVITFRNKKWEMLHI